MLRRRRLDEDVVLQEEIRRAQAFLARVDPEREVVETVVRADGVLDVDQLVRLDRQAHPRAGLAAAVEDDLLVEPVAEDVRCERAARGDVGGEQVHVVELLHRRAAADVAHRLVLQRRTEMLGRDVALGLEVELEDVVVRIGEPVRRSVAVVAVDPADPAAARLDQRDAPRECVGAPRADAHVPDSIRRRLGQLQAVPL